MRIRTLATVSAISAVALAGAASPALAQKTINVSSDKKAPLAYKGMPKTLKAGTYTFRYTNNSGIPHNLKIGKVSTPVFKSGTKTIKVTLKKGTTAYICTVPGHGAAGMKGRLRVT
jgi:plastocyanin